MKNSQLIKLLKTFNSKEIKKFSEFISSPYFNKNKNVIKLYEVIKKAHPGFKQENLTKENLFSSIFPGKKYNDNILRLLIHLLCEKARKFLAYNRVEKDIYKYKEELVSELFDRELYNESIKEIDKTISELEKSYIRDSDYFQYKFEFGVIKLNCIQKIKQGKYEMYITTSSIETPFKNLTYFFFSKLLTYYSLALNDKKTYNIDIDTDLLEKLFSYFDYELFNDSPLIQMYYNIVMIQKTNDDKYFYTLKNLVQIHEKSLIPMRLLNVYIHLENFCIWKIGAGEKHFHRELFEIHKLVLDKQIYKVDPFMRHYFYRNVLQNAAKIKEFDWADNFIESYKNELRSDYREAVYCYCKAYLEAEKNNFEKSLDYLSKLHTDEVYLKIDLHLLQARLYYELDWYDVLNSAIDSIRHLLKSNKFISENRRLRFFTLIKFLSALNNARLKNDELKIHELNDKILKTEDLQWKDWFIKKIEELEAAL
jgi:prophage maintenance system killer protein